MRSDMYKVIVERPRGGKGDYSTARRWRDDHDGPRQLGMRAGYGRIWLNENLRPLERYLHAQVGRPWNKVYSEISAGIDRRNTVQLHVFAHLDDMIATQVTKHQGRLVDLKRRWPSSFDRRDLSQPLYVDPDSGLIRVNKQKGGYKFERLEQKAREAAEAATRRKPIGGERWLMLIDHEWYEVQLAPLPPVYMVEKVIDGRLCRSRASDRVYDAILRCQVQRERNDHVDRQIYFYGKGCCGRGAREVYAVSKRQLSRREIESHGLRRNGSS